MSDHRRLNNSAFKTAIEELITKADGKAEEFGLTQPLVDELKATSTTLGADIAVQALKKAEARASTTKLNGTRKTADDLYAKAKRQAKDSGVGADKLAEIGIDADDLTPSSIAPQTPSDLVAQGFSSGKNTLKFNRNGNKTGTIFLIEAKIGDAANYVIIGTTTKTTYNHTGQKPGVKVVYRVRAQRGDDFSEYSNEAVVYE
jgi:uncharacterized protein YggE